MGSCYVCEFDGSNVYHEKGCDGNIGNVASIGIDGCRAGTAYTVSKHAVVGLAKNTAFMYCNGGVR